MKTILFTDLDGTLITGDRYKDDPNEEALIAFRQKGHKVALCTGRTWFEVQKLRRAIDLSCDFMVLTNGGELRDGEGHPLLTKTITPEDGMAALKTLISHDELDLDACDRDIQLSRVEDELLIYPDKTLYDGTLEDAFQETEGFVLLSCHRKDWTATGIDALAEALRDQLPGRAEVHRNDVFLDIVPEGCDKAAGMRDMMTFVHEPMRTAAIGDSYNDIGMLAEADISATFPEAPEEVRKAADVTVHSVAEFLNIIMEDV